jgi:hypothetical protein
MVGMTWNCKKCNYEVIITDGWEFYRDQSGKLKRYSHPCLISVEGIKGIRGFSADLYCPTCKDIKNAIVEEFGKVVTQTCDICGTKLKKSLDDSDLCPQCNSGTFIFRDIWTS